MIRIALRLLLLPLFSLYTVGCMTQAAPRLKKGPSQSVELDSFQPRAGELEDRVAYDPYREAAGRAANEDSEEGDSKAGYVVGRARYSPPRAQIGEIPSSVRESPATLGESTLGADNVSAPGTATGAEMVGGEISSIKPQHSLDTFGIQVPPNRRSYADVVRARAETRSYRSPLAVGNPGESASLYRESRSAVNDIYHDYRAFQPMDLITVVITEVAEGNRIANTNSKQESSFSAAITGLLGLDDWFFGRNQGIDPNAVIATDTESEFKGQGQMLRSDRLRGTISAMVTEVLPSGILRIEGQKVIAVNSEEQVMVISGLVRPRDVSSANTVESNKIANVRIDFFGKGTLGDIQSPGWFVEMLNWLWPF